MKNVVGSIVLTAIVAVIVGLGAGIYIEASRARAALEAVPASPIVVSANYIKEKNEVVFELFNPGVQPLTLVDQTVVFTPGKESKEKAYALAAVPLGVALPGGTSVKVHLALKADSEKLKPGDVVAGTITYTHPLAAGDVYSVTHLFKLEEGK